MGDTGHHGHIRVVLINEGSKTQTIGIRAATGSGVASVARLLAPEASSRSGVTLAGESFGNRTTTGWLAGHLNVTDVAATQGSFVVQVPGTSAAYVELP